MVMGHGDVVIGRGDLVMNHGDVVVGHGDVVVGHGDVAVGHGDTGTWRYLAGVVAPLSHTSAQHVLGDFAAVDRPALVVTHHGDVHALGGVGEGLWGEGHMSWPGLAGSPVCRGGPTQPNAGRGVHPLETCVHHPRRCPHPIQCKSRCPSLGDLGPSSEETPTQPNPMQVKVSIPWRPRSII